MGTGAKLATLAPSGRFITFTPLAIRLWRPIESVAVTRDAAGSQVLLVATIHGEVWRVDDPAAVPE